MTTYIKTVITERHRYRVLQMESTQKKMEGHCLPFNIIKINWFIFSYRFKNYILPLVVQILFCVYDVHEPLISR